MEKERKERGLADLRMLAGMNRKQFAEYFGIPYRTVENWEVGNRAIPAYVLSLIEYKLEHENMLLPGWTQGGDEDHSK